MDYVHRYHGNMPDSPDHRLASFASELAFDAIPADVLKLAKRAILNVVATLLAGCREPAVDTALSVLAPFGSAGSATLVGRETTADPLLAAMLNAMAANVHDFDDTHMPTILHPSSPVLPPLLALAESTPMSGSDLLRSFVLGVEIACRVGRAISPSHYARGFHITSTCGVFGSAAAYGRQIGLSPGKMLDAFSSAAVQAGGMVEMLGTMAKSISVGDAARGGMIAAELARRDFGGPPRPLTGERGFLPLYGDNADAGCLTRKLGEDWELRDVALKPYPVGVVLNPVVDAAMELRDRGIAGPQSVSALTFNGHPLLKERTDRPDVATGRLSQVSAHHAVAIVFLRGKAGLAEFSDEAVRATQGIRPPCSFIDEADRDPSSVRMTCRTREGDDIVIDIPSARGSIRNPMSDKEIEDKVRACADYAGVQIDTDRLFEVVWSLEGMEDVRDFAKLLGSTR